MLKIIASATGLTQHNIFVPQYLVYTTTHVTTSYISAYLDDIIKTKPISIPNTTNKLDIFVNVDKKSESFVMPIKTTTVSLNLLLAIIVLGGLRWGMRH